MQIPAASEIKKSHDAIDTCTPTPERFVSMMLMSWEKAMLTGTWILFMQAAVRMRFMEGAVTLAMWLLEICAPISCG